MKEDKLKFIKKLIIFVIVLFLIIFLLNKTYFKLVIEKKQQFREEIELQNYLKNNKQLDYVFFGDSHTHAAINPKYILNSFNLGFSSNTHIESYYKLKKLIYYDKIKIRTIVLETDLHTFSSYMLGPSFPLKTDIWYYAQFIPVKEIALLTNKSETAVYISSIFPFIGRGNDFFADKTPSETYLGWVKNEGNFSETDMRSLTSQRISDQFDNQVRIDKTLLLYFAKTLDLAKRNNITVVLIKYPQSKIYDEFVEKENIVKDGYYNQIFEISNKVIKDYYILDYYSLFFDKLNYFADPDHLNYRGSEVLSKKVNIDLREINQQLH